jgi:hypothetical protein
LSYVPALRDVSVIALYCGDWMVAARFRAVMQDHDLFLYFSAYLNERIRVSSLMDGRRFLYEVVTLYGNSSD